MGLSFLLQGTFSIKLILVRGYLSCKIQMYLSHDFHFNPTLSHSSFGYFTVDFLCFLFQGSRNTWLFLLSELVGYESGFLVNLLITMIWENNHVSPSFFACTSSIPYPCCFPSLSIPVSIPIWESQESLSLSSWLVKITSPFQCVSVTDFFNRNLFQSRTNNMCFKLILKLFTKGCFKVTSRW